MTAKMHSLIINQQCSGKFKVHDETRVTVKDFMAMTRLKRKKAQNTVFTECVRLDYIRYQEGCRRNIRLGGIRDWWTSSFPDSEIPDFETLLVEVLAEKARNKQEKNKRLFHLDELFPNRTLMR